MHSMSHNKNGDLMVYFYQIIYYFMLFLCTTQIQPFLISQGFNRMECAYFYSGSALAGYLLQWLYQKYFSKISLIKCAKVGMILLVCLVYLLNRSIFVFGCAICLYALSKTLINFNEVYCFQDKEKYGVLRSFASIGMSIGALVSMNTKSYVFLLIVFLMIIIFIRLDSFQPKASSVILKMCIKDDLFILMVSLLFAIGSADQYLVTQKILELDGNRSIVGLKMAIQCMSEIPFYLAMNKIFQRISYQKIMRCSIIFFGIRFLLYGMLQHAYGIVFASILQGLSLPLMMSASKYYIKKLHPEGGGTSQLKLLSIFTTIALFVAPIGYGLLLQIMNLDSILYLCVLLCIVVFVIQLKLDKC